MRSDPRRIPGRTLAVSAAVLLAACAPDDRQDPGAVHAQERPTFPADLLASPDRHEFGVTIHPDGREIFFGVDTAERSEVWVTRYAGAAWTEPEPFLRSDRHRHFDPYLADEGATLYFLSDRPRAAGDPDPRQDADIWRMFRLGDGRWSDPEPLPPGLNTDFDEFYVSIDDLGRLAFSSNRNTGQPGERDYDLYITDGPVSEPFRVERLGLEFSTRAYEGDPLIAPDGSYVVFSSYRRSGLGGSDLYLSARSEGGWSPLVNLGPRVNTEADELCPVLDPTGDWFLFTSNEDIRRVGISVLDEARREAARRSLASASNESPTGGPSRADGPDRGAESPRR